MDETTLKLLKRVCVYHDVNGFEIAIFKSALKNKFIKMDCIGQFFITEAGKAEAVKYVKTNQKKQAKK